MKELRKRASELNIPGRSKMGREELEAAIFDVTGPPPIEYGEGMKEDDIYSHVFTNDGVLIPVPKMTDETKGEADMSANEEIETVSIHEIIDQVSADFVNEQNDEKSVTDTDDNSSETVEPTDTETFNIDAEAFVPDYPTYDTFREAVKDQIKMVRYFRHAIARGVGDWANILLSSHVETLQILFQDRHNYLPKKKVTA